MNKVFKPEITLGHLVQLAGMVATAIGIYVNARIERVQMMDRLKTHDDAIVELSRREAACEDTMHVLAITTAKLEERTSHWPSTVPRGAQPKTGAN